MKWRVVASATGHSSYGPPAGTKQVCGTFETSEKAGETARNLARNNAKHWTYKVVRVLTRSERVARDWQNVLEAKYTGSTKKEYWRGYDDALSLVIADLLAERPSRG